MPFTLPLFIPDPHQLEDEPQYADVEMGLGEPRVRRLTTLANKRVKGRWHVSHAISQQMVTDWYENTLEGGTLPFDVEVVAFGTGTTTYRGTFLEPPTYTSAVETSSLWWDIDAYLLLRADVTPISLPSAATSPLPYQLYFLDNFSVPGILTNHIPDAYPEGFVSWSTTDGASGKIFAGLVTLGVDTVTYANWDALNLSTGFSFSFSYVVSNFAGSIYARVYGGGYGPDNYVQITLSSTTLSVFDGPSLVTSIPWPGYGKAKVIVHLGTTSSFVDVNGFNQLIFQKLSDFTNFNGRVSVYTLYTNAISAKFDQVILYRDDDEEPSGTFRTLLYPTLDLAVRLTEDGGIRLTEDDGYRLTEDSA